METNDSTPSLPFGTRVEIGGRTMLRPGFSLVGLTGMVYLPSPNTPAGCSTVVVDWTEHGYTPEKGYPSGSLPPLVNVPTIHLTILGEDGAPLVPEKPKAATPKETPSLKPLRKLSTPEATMPKDESPQTDEPKPDDDEPNERPRLRLV